VAYVKYNTVQGCSLYPTDARRHIGKLYQSLLYTGNFCVQFMVIVQDPAFTVRWTLAWKEIILNFTICRILKNDDLISVMYNYHPNTSYYCIKYIIFSTMSQIFKKKKKIHFKILYLYCFKEQFRIIWSVWHNPLIYYLFEYQ
jgi:hypothetical protein